MNTRDVLGKYHKIRKSEGFILKGKADIAVDLCRLYMWTTCVVAGIKD
jgi:hypothetical protein